MSLAIAHRWMLSELNMETEVRVLVMKPSCTRLSFLFCSPTVAWITENLIIIPSIFHMQIADAQPNSIICNHVSSPILVCVEYNVQLTLLSTERSTVAVMPTRTLWTHYVFNNKMKCQMRKVAFKFKLFRFSLVSSVHRVARCEFTFRHVQWNEK